MQRFFDITFSLMGLIIFAPIFVFILCILRLSGEGNIFYFQDRVGKNGITFKLFKFVTMLKDSPNMGTGTVTMKDDPRVLPIGKILRKTKINELLQLVNILIGDMSIIGPRPMTQQNFSAYSEQIQKKIIQVKPGLSGIGSIFFHCEEDIMSGKSATLDFYKNIIAPYKGVLEEWYISNQGLYVYFTAIFLTAWVIMNPKTSLHWRVFKNIPQPPSELKIYMNYQFQ